MTQINFLTYQKNCIHFIPSWNVFQNVGMRISDILHNFFEHIGATDDII